MIKEPDYVADVEKYQADPDGFMEEEVPAETPKTPKTKRVTVADDTATAEDLEGFEVVGRDGKAVAFTPESILKSKCFCIWRSSNKYRLENHCRE
jgi:hypothetical protein